MKVFLAAALALAAVGATPAFATTTLLTTDPGTGTTTTFDVTGLSFRSAGPVVVDGYTVTGDPNVDYGNTLYGLGDNGYWTTLSWVATDEVPDAITFDLNGSFGFVGGFMNYAPNYGEDATITALAADGVTVLGSYDLETLAPINTPGGSNAGAFRGISSSSNDIAFLQLSGDYILTNSIEVGNAATGVTPEPSSLVLMATGLAGAVGAFRRKLQA